MRRAADAIVAASEEIRTGRLHGEFVVDVIQGGAGTSTNMNANEVIANRALELLGAKGDYKFLHPNEHVNMSQSTNDVYPTALKLAAYSGIMRLVEPWRCCARRSSTSPTSSGTSSRWAAPSCRTRCR
jgi:Aspartate ammonia-lyase